MGLEQVIHDKLVAELAPTECEVINESHLHAGHAGSPGTGESHFRITIIAPAFAGKTRLQIHQQINQVLKDELAGAIHALSISASAPE